MGHSNDSDPATETPIVHSTVKLPTVLFRVVDLDRLEVRGAVETTDGHQLPVDNRKTNLEERKQRY